MGIVKILLWIDMFLRQVKLFAVTSQTKRASLYFFREKHLNIS